MQESWTEWPRSRWDRCFAWNGSCLEWIGTLEKTLHDRALKQRRADRDEMGQMRMGAKGAGSVPFRDVILRQVACWMLVLLPGVNVAAAQQPAARVTAEINSAERAVIKGSHPPMAQSANEIGECRRAPGSRA